MSRSTGVGLGGFLIGIGVGWIIFRSIDVSFDTVAYILIIIGVSSIISGIVSGGDKRSPLRGLISGLTGGLVLALFITSGFSLISELAGIPWTGFGDYRASKTRTFTGESSFNSISLVIETVNGGITVSTWGNEEYLIDVIIRAKGMTDAEAQENLERLTVGFTDSVSLGVQRLELGFQAPDDQWNRYAVEVSVYLPEESSMELDLETSNGEVELNEIVGSTVSVATSNGALTFNQVYADSITGRTSNGKIRGTLEGSNTSLRTSNGGIELNIPCTVSARYELHTSNGAIDVSVSGLESIGYDLDLDTSVGSIDIGLSDLNYIRNDRTRKIARTEGYENKSIQVEIDAGTSIGDIDIT